jgi:putative acetyltransferase
LPQILSIHQQAFGEDGYEIAGLVKNLFNDPSACPILSLIAESSGRPAGHILFARATLEGSDLRVALLAPLAVVPECQSRGIGQRLIQEGLKQLKQAGADLVLVLGHPGYYPKAGFRPDAGALGLQAPFPIEPKNAAAWMVQELRPGILGSVRGTVQCADALNRPEYWVE